jgi:hypothetical protein
LRLRFGSRDSLSPQLVRNDHQRGTANNLSDSIHQWEHTDTVQPSSVLVRPSVMVVAADVIGCRKLAIQELLHQNSCVV